MDAMTNADRRVTRANLEHQLIDLSKRSVLFVPKHDRRKGDPLTGGSARKRGKAARAADPGANGETKENAATAAESLAARQVECYLTWSSEPEDGKRATTLGPYARWLIAVHLLMSLEQQELLEDVVRVGTVNRVFMFTPTNRLLRSPGRYVVAGAEDDYEPALREIIAGLNGRFGRRRGRAIDHDTFLHVLVPMSVDENIVGDRPIAWFKQWLEWGVGKPSPDSVHKLLQEGARQAVHGPADRARRNEVIRAILGCRARQAERDRRSVGSGRPGAAIAKRRQPPTHHRIVNIGLGHVVAGPSPLAVDLAKALTAQRPRRDPASVMYVRLDAGASRQKVLHQLYEAFSLDTARLQDLAHRTIDLAADLDPVRRALTVNSVIVIFDGWDNVGGPFRSFYEFLCNTHWGEFLRVLAQPHLGAEPGHLHAKSVLVVISARQVLELRPWSKFLGDAVPASADAAAARAGVISRKEIFDLEAEVRGTQAHAAAWDRLVCEVVLRMVAASINGLRRGTLERCLDHWIRLYWRKHVDLQHACEPDTLQSQIDAAVKRYPGLLREIEDEELEGLSPVNRSLELNRVPQVPPLDSQHRQLQGDAALVPSQRRKRTRGAVVQAPPQESHRDLTQSDVVFVSLALRAAFVSEWLNQELGASEPGAEDVGGRTTCSWACINFILGEEALRQGTSQLRHLPPEALGSAYAVRRILQTIYHGLQSLEQSPQGSAQSDSTFQLAAYGAVLPLEPARRYRYLFTFLYRHVTEAGEWKLSRAFGRSDIKVALLSIFVLPCLGTRMLAESAEAGSVWRLREQGRALIAPVLKSDPAMWCDLLEALGRAGLDLDQGNGLVARVLRQLPGGADTAQTNALLPWRDRSYFRVATAALRLRIDWLQAKGELDEAEELCWKELARYGIDASMFTDLRKAVLDGLGCEPSVVSRSVKQDLEDALHRELSTLMRTTMFLHVGENMSTILFRLGEILATRAEDAAERSGTPGEIAEFAYAFAIFWVADRLRSESAGLGHAELRWPLSGSRVVRYYVRVCLKLARLLTKLDSGERLHEPVNWLLDLAHSRSGAYARHHYRFRRDQILMLGLEAARVRTWVRVDLDRQRPKFAEQQARYLRDFAKASEEKERAERAARAAGASVKSRSRVKQKVAASEEPPPADPRQVHGDWMDQCDDQQEFLDTQKRRLDAAWALLQEAEGHLFALGYQSAHLRRVHLERIKTLKAFHVLSRHYDEFAALARSPLYVNPMKAQLPTYRALRDSLLDALEESSARNAFWKNIVKRQRERDLTESY